MASENFVNSNSHSVGFDCTCVFRFISRIRSDRAKLKIYEPSRLDAGIYTLEGYSADMNTSETVTLHFLGKDLLPLH